MSTPTIQFRDANGAATITAQGLSLNNWVPDVDEIGDRQTPVGTGLESFWRYRRDFWASFEMPHIPAANLANLHRLKSHLLTGGFITVSTNDSASRVYTCSVKPGATPAWSFSDRTMCEYTLALEVRNVMPYPMICDYSSYGGTSGNLITNGDGETGDDGDAASGWTNDSGDSLVIDDAQAYLGSQSLLHANTGANTGQATSQTKGVAVGTRYLLSGWIRLDGSEDDTAVLDLFAFPVNYSIIARHNALSTDSAGVTSAGSVVDWTYAAILYDGTDDGGIKAYLRTDSAGAASAWFDGIRLEVVPAV